MNTSIVIYIPAKNLIPYRVTRPLPLCLSVDAIEGYICQLHETLHVLSNPTLFPIPFQLLFIRIQGSFFTFRLPKLLIGNE